jgi:hypothetical protein
LALMRITAASTRAHVKAAKSATRNIFGVLCVLCILASLASVACGGTNLFRQYEYEEDMYLSLDGSATLTVSTSIPALNALRGTSFDASPNARTDREAVRSYYSTPNTHVVWVRASRRSNRRFVHVRIDVDDVRRLNQAAPFAWSSYEFRRDDKEYSYRQTIAAAAGHDAGHTNWTGREMVSFRLHLPSEITYQNTPDRRRGNILVWEQRLAERLMGAPLTIETRMETQSILYRTLWLFGATFLAVAVAFALVIVWVLKRGGAPPDGARLETPPG